MCLCLTGFGNKYFGSPNVILLCTLISGLQYPLPTTTPRVYSTLIANCVQNGLRTCSGGLCSNRTDAPVGSVSWENQTLNLVTLRYKKHSRVWYLHDNHVWQQRNFYQTSILKNNSPISFNIINFINIMYIIKSVVSCTPPSCHNE